MYKAFFKGLAERENGKFYYHDKDISIGMGVRSPNVIYKVKFSYKNNEIEIINRTGTAYTGIINCELTKTIQPIEFEINNISHIQNLFLRRKSRLTIKTPNENLKYFLSKNKHLKKMGDIANKEKFSPIIKCELRNKWKILTEYHLEFDNWIQVVEPIIGLYKDLIDEYDKRIANLSSKSYREIHSGN